MSSFPANETACEAADPEAVISRNRVTALAIACPFDDTNPETCPLHAMRNLPVLTRFQWILSQPGAEIRRILRHHIACLQEKQRTGREQ